MAIEFNDYIKKKVKEALTEIAFRMEAKAVEKVPVRTGNLKASIQSGVEGNTVWVGAGFKTEVNYAEAVEYGTRPHIIKAKGRNKGGKDALYWKGAKHPVKQVKHPGTRPRPFLRPAVFETQMEIPKILAKHLTNI